jgi:hypothetical protein
MQPCAVCGGVQVNAAGYCTQCGTFRGLPQQPPPPPPSYPQAPPPGYPGYPQPGSPPAYPTSVPPAGYPTSVPPAYQQTSGGGYPGYPQPPQRGRSYLVPLVALSATLVVLVVAIAIVVAVGGGGDDPIAGPTTTPTSGGPVESASAAPGGDVDDCVIGTWRVTSHKETVPIEGQGNVTFTGGEGATLRLNRDGTGVTDYGSGTEYRGELSGETVRLEVSGRLTYKYTADDGRVSVTDVESTAKGRFVVGSEEYEIPEPFDTKDNSASYTCSTDLLTQNTALLTTEYERVS